MSGQQFDIKTHAPVVAKKGSYKVEVEEGKDYYICSCGLSQNQPFCDGSHAQLADHPGPLKYTARESKTVGFCGCKQTRNAPLCDGAHKRIPADVAVGDTFVLPADAAAAAPPPPAAAAPPLLGVGAPLVVAGVALLALAVYKFTRTSD